jgi:hypothetical protein
MYPKPLQDLSGWDVRSIGCSFTSIVVAADDSVIAWGPSPTFGELVRCHIYYNHNFSGFISIMPFQGLGEMRKSSTTPIEVKALEGVYIMHVVCGVSHTLMLARDDSEEEKARLQDFPVYSVP